MLFVVNLICCGRDDGVFGPTSWKQADAFREDYCTGPGTGTGGHDRSGIISAAPDAPWDFPVHHYGSARLDNPPGQHTATDPRKL